MKGYLHLKTKKTYNYVKIVHTGEDYITVKYGKSEYEITGIARYIITTLLRRINEK